MKLPPEFIDQLQKMIQESTIHNQQSSHNSNQGAKQKKTPDELLFELATINRNLYHDKSLRTYIEIHDSKLQQSVNTRLVRIESAEFRKWLKREYRINYKKVMSNKGLIEAIQDEVSEEARINGEEIRIYNRIAHVNGEIFIDLGTQDRSVVKITRTGWAVGNYKIYFNRHNEFAELPVPVKGGKITDLIPFFPKLPERDLCLILSWLIATYFDGIERAFLLLEGEKGFGKTRIARLLRTFIDPSHQMVTSYNDKVDEVAQHIDHNCLPIYDNFSAISRKVSDLLCGAFSESSYAKKKLYTDGEDYVFALSGNVIFTSKGLKNAQTDLLDRCYKVKVKKVDSLYDSKQIFTEQFESIKPQLFGAILDTVVATMNEVENVPTSGKFRTVDFDRHALAAARVMKFGDDLFYEARRHCEKVKIIGISDNTPLLEAVTNFLESNQNYYSGYMSKLVEILPSYTSEPNSITKHAQVLSKQLSKIKNELYALGITVTPKGNDHRGARYEIKRVVPSTGQPETDVAQQNLDNTYSNVPVHDIHQPPSSVVNDTGDSSLSEAEMQEIIRDISKL